MSTRDFLPVFVDDFAQAMTRVDAKRPVAVRHGGDQAFQPGIGPHPEDEVVRMCMEDLADRHPGRYAGYQRLVRYPGSSRAKCDLVIGGPDSESWAIELKLLRFLGDNGKQNGNMLMHILSPYPQDRSALTDCTKLCSSGLAKRCAVVIFGYEHADWPLEPAISAFERLAMPSVKLGPRQMAATGTLVHPVHAHGRVYGWELLAPVPTA